MIHKQQSAMNRIYTKMIVIVFRMIVYLVNYSNKILWMVEIRSLQDNRELLPTIIWIITAIKENY